MAGRGNSPAFVVPQIFRRDASNFLEKSIDKRHGLCYYNYRKEVNHMRKGKIYCPVNGWDCPYYQDRECGLEDPYRDCDDFFSQWEGETDYICEDEERTAYLDERG